MSKILVAVQKKDLEAVKKLIKERNKPAPKPIKRWETLDKRTADDIDVVIKAAKRLSKDAEKLLRKVVLELRKFENLEADDLTKADAQWMDKEFMKLEEYEMSLADIANVMKW